MKRPFRTGLVAGLLVLTLAGTPVSGMCRDRRRIRRAER